MKSSLHVVMVMFVMVTEEENEEICDLTYVEMNRNRYIVGVGWDRRINIYNDDLSDSNIHHVQYPLPKWQDDMGWRLNY